RSPSAFLKATDFLTVYSAEKEDGKQHGENFRDGERPPDGRQAEGFRQQPGRRQKNDQLPDQGGQHAVESASQSLKDRTQNDAAAGYNKAETDDAHGRNADSQHMVGGVKDSKQLFRNHTEESQAGQHQKSGGDC